MKLKDLLLAYDSSYDIRICDYDKDDGCTIFNGRATNVINELDIKYLDYKVYSFRPNTRETSIVVWVVEK